MPPSGGDTRRGQGALEKLGIKPNLLKEAIKEESRRREIEAIEVRSRS